MFFFPCRLKIHFYLLADNTIKEQTIVIHSEGMHKVFLQSVDSVIMPHLANLWQFSMFQQGFPGNSLVILVWWKFTKANYGSMWCCNVTLTPHGSWAYLAKIPNFLDWCFPLKKRSKLILFQMFTQAGQNLAQMYLFLMSSQYIFL